MKVKCGLTKTECCEVGYYGERPVEVEQPGPANFIIIFAPSVEASKFVVVTHLIFQVFACILFEKQLEVLADQN